MTNVIIKKVLTKNSCFLMYALTLKLLYHKKKQFFQIVN